MSISPWGSGFHFINRPPRGAPRAECHLKAMIVALGIMWRKTLIDIWRKEPGRLQPRVRPSQQCSSPLLLMSSSSEMN
jgi:hypothetical protein